MRLGMVGRNPRAGGWECVIFGQIGLKSHAFAPIAKDSLGGERRGREFVAFGPWDIREMRPGAGLAPAPAIVAVNTDEAYCHTSGRLVLVSHSWSGVLQISNIGRRYTVDLYSEATRLVFLDLVNEILVDVTGLAVTDNHALKLPALTIATLLKHIVEQSASFRFLDSDADYRPSPARRAIELLRARPGEKLRQRLLAELLPAIAARRTPAPAVQPPPALPPPPAPEDVLRLRDELRLLTAAVEGLALRAPAET